MLLPLLLALGAAAPSPGPAGPSTATPPAATPPAANVNGVVLPGADGGPVALDYIAIDRPRHRVWVPAGGTGRVDVLDTQAGHFTPIEGFATADVERRGTKWHVGPSSVTLGGGVAFVGSRGDSSVCAVDAAALAKGACVKLASMPDGVAFVAARHEVWVTTPRDSSITILDVSKPAALTVAGRIGLDGSPEGYALDDTHGVFYTNLEDKDKTLRLDVSTRKVTATWSPGCGDEGPRGLVVDPDGPFVVVACTDHLAVLDAGHDGKVLSQLPTGEGVDNLDWVPSRREIVAAAGRAATLTVAKLGRDGTLTKEYERPTSPGARNAVMDDAGTSYVADGKAGRLDIVTAP